MVQHQKQCHPLLVRSSKALSKWRERIAATQDTPEKKTVCHSKLIALPLHSLGLKPSSSFFNNHQPDSSFAPL